MWQQYAKSEAKTHQGRCTWKLFQLSGSVSEESFSPGDAKICSVGDPIVCEGEIFDIEVDSGVEVSCLLWNISVETYPLHETRISTCGGHHVAAGGKLHEFGARVLGWTLQLCEAMLWNCWCDSESRTFAKRFCRHKILACLVGRLSSLLIAAITILPGKFQAFTSRSC